MLAVARDELERAAHSGRHHVPPQPEALYGTGA